MTDLKTQISSLVFPIDINQEKVNVWVEEMQAWRKETKASKEATEAYMERKEPAPVEMANVVVHPGVPNM
jgi:sirohydrochlorin ferrochelatase